MRFNNDKLVWNIAEGVVKTTESYVYTVNQNTNNISYNINMFAISLKKATLFQFRGKLKRIQSQTNMEYVKYVIQHQAKKWRDF